MLLPQLMDQALPSASAVVEALSTMADHRSGYLVKRRSPPTTNAKEVQKAARRALYRLKTMGVDTDSVRVGEPRQIVLRVPKLPIVHRRWQVRSTLR